MNCYLYCFLIVFAEIAAKTFLVKTVDKLISRIDSGEHGSDYVLDKDVENKHVKKMAVNKNAVEVKKNKLKKVG